MNPFSIGSVRIDPPLALAPMAEVTDTYYRSLIKELGGVGLVRIKIWNKSGMIAFSDEPKLVGQHFPISEELAESLEGRTTASILRTGDLRVR